MLGHGSQEQILEYGITTSDVRMLMEFSIFDMFKQWNHSYYVLSGECCSFIKLTHVTMSASAKTLPSGRKWTGNEQRGLKTQDNDPGTIWCYTTFEK